MVERRQLVAALGVFLSAACTGLRAEGGCDPDDVDGVVGGQQTVLLTLSDRGYAVGGVNSGSTQPNIAVQNSSSVTLIATNVGSKPHSLRIACIPTHLPAGCPAMSCFPEVANLSALAAGESVTVQFATPAVEGAYRFSSDEPGDTKTDESGNVTGLVGQFVLM